MKKNLINLDRQYLKLYGQISARLVSVDLLSKTKMSSDFLTVDTMHYDETTGTNKVHEYPNGLLLVLTYVGNKFIPFTVTIKGSEKRLLSYEQKIGQEFDINITNVKQSTLTEIIFAPSTLEPHPEEIEQSIEASELAEAVGA